LDGRWEESHEQARYVAEAIAREAFHNVTFFEGTYPDFVRATRD
jgi:hypothetical protein